MSKVSKKYLILMITSSLMILVFCIAIFGIKHYQKFFYDPNNLPQTFLAIPKEEEEILEDYRAEVRKRRSAERYFSEEEYAFFSPRVDRMMFSEIEDFSYPVVYRVGEKELLLAYSNDGVLQFVGGEKAEELNQKFARYSLHINQKSRKGKEIHLTEDRSLQMDSSGWIQFWSFGEMIGEIQIPEDTQYVGILTIGGYLFQKGQTVYQVTPTEYKVLATDVVKVLMSETGNIVSSLVSEDGGITIFAGWYH